MSTRQLNLPSNVPYPQDDDDDENQSFSYLMSHFSNGGDDLEQIIQNESHNLVVDDSIKNDVRLTPSEINLLANEVANSKEFLVIAEEINISDLEDVRRDTDEVEQFLNTLNVTCESCITYEKVTRIRQIKPADHIRFHRELMGINFYNHHAIITQVYHHISDPKKGQMTLVHFNKNIRGVLTVVKETKEFNMAAENIDIVKYKSHSYTAEEIISTAKKMADKFENGQQAESYSFLGNNCEDKSNEIATGSKFSQQVSSIANYVKSTITWLLKYFLRVAIRFCNKMKTYIRGFAHISVILSLLILIDQIASLKSKLKKGFLCLKCYQKEHTKLMTSLLFCLISVGISVVSHTSGTYVAVCTVIAIALPFASSFLVDTVGTFIQPGYNVSKQVVRRCDMLRKGDVITFPYFGLGHEGVITGMTPLSDNLSEVVKVTVVHFNYVGLFGTRTVVEEDFFFNLARQSVHVYDFSGEKVHTPQEVVARAIEKKGSQNFDMFSNRSSHLSRYCKVKLNLI
jgi:hypothetical protein